MKRITPTFEEFINESDINEAKMTAAKIVKLLKNDEDWGDLGDYVHVEKGLLVVVDTFYYGEKKSMDNLVKRWSPGGEYAKIFKDEHGVDFEVVDTFSELRATGRYKKITTDGIVGLKLKIK